MLLLFRRIVAPLLMALGVAAMLPSSAEDIDLFIQPSGSGAGDRAKVLIVLDNGASFSASTDTRCHITADGTVTTPTTGNDNSTPEIDPTDLSNSTKKKTLLSGTSAGLEQCALYTVIKSLPAAATATIEIGFMVFNENGQKAWTLNTASTNGGAASSGVCGDESGFPGGCLVLPMTQFTPANRDAILKWIRQWSGTTAGFNIKSNNLQSGGVMQEAWASLYGKTGVSGRNYASIAPSAGCGKNTVIFVGNAWRNNTTPNDQTGDKGPKNALFGTNSTSLMNANPAATADEKLSIVESMPTTCGGAGNTLLQTSENKGAYALNWAKYLKNRGTTVYSVGLLGSTCNAEYEGHLRKMGDKDVGGGQYYAANSYEDLVLSFNDIFLQIQAVNSVFASVSLPVSVNTQGTYLNQVYVGLFRPDESGGPQWYGNLKQYKLGFVGSDLRLLDATDTAAIGVTTGFLRDCARSFWTPSSVDTYWSGDPKGECNTVPGTTATLADLKKSDFPDGNIVEKGGQSFKTRSLTGASSRTVYTCSTNLATCGSTATLMNFDTSISASATDFNTTTTGRNTLINYTRGQNVKDELGKGTSAVRPTVHGDVVHSRPVAINYGTDASPQVVVYYGANDGTLRAINGNRSTTHNGATAGSEFWAFVPPEFYAQASRLYENTPTVAYIGNPWTNAQPKPYGMDGPISASQESGSVKLYATMRRGGRVVYAFDVSNPAAPSMLWKKGCPNPASDAGCSTDFEQIGQTWSTVKPMKTAGYGGGTSTLVIFGGGYDTCEDYDAKVAGGANHNCSSPKGNRIFVLDGATGALVKSFTTLRSVPSDVTLVRDSAGLITYAYAADTGGNVYRIDFTGPSTSWTMTHIAAVGCSTGTSCTPQRKFLFGPSVIAIGSGVYGILLGSGDREKPVIAYTATQSVQNYFFMFRDKPGDASWLSSESGTCGASRLCLNALYAISGNTTPSPSDLATKKGWYVSMTAKEQVVTSAITLFGTVSFSTHQPAQPVVGSCTSNLGETRVYNVNYEDAASKNGTNERWQDLVGDGLPPSPVGGLVTLDNGQTVPFCIGCSPLGSIEGKIVESSSSVVRPKGRVYWYIQK